MEPASSLPNELLEIIISNIDPTSRAGQSSLKACSHVNQALYFISQKRLFESVSLTYKLGRVEGGVVLYDDARTTGHKFLNLINSSPHISAYVKKLSIDELPREAMLPSDPNRTSWNASDAATFSLYAIAAQCKGLEIFVSKCFIDWDNSRDERFIEARTQAFFLALVRRVSELDYRTFHSFPISAFSGCHNVERLHISSLSEAGHDDASQPEAEQVHLLSLNLTEVNEDEATLWFDSPFSPFNITRLQSLRISLTRSNIPEMEKIVVLSSGTLESLDIRMDLYRTRPAGITNPLSLETLHALRTLEIQVHIGHFMYRQPPGNRGVNNGGGIYVNDFSYIASMLQTLPYIQDRRRALEVNLSLGASDFRTFEKQFMNIPWFDLVSVLSEDETSLRVTKVNLLIVPFEDGSPLAVPTTTLTNVLDRNEGLQKLREKGFLSYGCY